MKEVTKYQCEICGNFYDTPQKAQRCESSGQPRVLNIGQRVIFQVVGYGEAKGTILAWRVGKGLIHLEWPYHPVYYRIDPDSCELGFVCMNEEFLDSYVRPLTGKARSKKTQKRCPNCGEPIDSDAKSCPSCGLTVSVA